MIFTPMNRLWGWSWETHPIQQRLFTDVKALEYNMVDVPPQYLFATTRSMEGTHAIGFRGYVPYRRKKPSIPIP